MSGTPVDVAGVLIAAQLAAGTKLCSISSRTDCIKVLLLCKHYEAMKLLEAIDDETFGAIVARAMGPAKGPKTPKGSFIDPDEKPKGPT